MQCEVCGYRLWNLRSRQCPECSHPFLPSEFEFVPNSVQFTCPLCSQAYYGTGEQGHLEPIDFDCVHCNQHIHMDEMIILPAEGLEEDATKVDRSVWIERGDRSFLQAWTTTVGRALVAPGRLIRSVPEGSSSYSALLLLFVNHMPVVLLGIIPYFIFPMMMVGMAGGGPGLSAFGLGSLIFLSIALLGLLFAVGFWGGVTHGILHVIGSPSASLGRTFQALCYSSGANVASAIPCVGLYFGWIWWLISAVVMVKEGQQVSTWRAAIAVTLLPLVAVIGVVGFYSWFIFVQMPQFSSGWGGWAQPATQTVLVDVLTHFANNDGKTPRHAASLLIDDVFFVDDLVGDTTATYPEYISIESTTLAKVPDMTRPERQALVEAVIWALPRETIAHRLGDFIFTCSDMEISKLDPQLWLVVYWPDPDQNSPPVNRDLIYVGLVDGTVNQFRWDQFAIKLTEQNVTRETAGLPPLPDLIWVTHANPAIATDNESVSDAPTMTNGPAETK